MFNMWIQNILIILALYSVIQTNAKPSFEEDAAVSQINFLTKYWKDMQYNIAKTLYDDNTDLDNFENKLIEFQRKKIEVYNQVKKYRYESFDNNEFKRRLQNLGSLRLSELNATEYVEIGIAVEALKLAYKQLTIKPYIKHGVSGELSEEQVKAIVRDTRNEQELEHYWIESNERGAFIKKMLTDIVPQMKNLSYYTDNINKLKMYYLPYEDPYLFNEIEQNINKLRPLYEKMHAYIRFVMEKDFGGFYIVKEGSISEHLFNHVLEKVAGLKLDPILADRKLDSYTGIKMLKEAHDWFKMLGMPNLPESFWENGVTEIETTPCVSTFFDFTTEARLRYCPDKSAKNYYQNYRHIVHAEYVTLMSELPPGLLGEPCPGFGDAIEKAMELSVNTLDNLRRAGVSTGDLYIERININKLAYMFFTDIIPLFKHFVYEKLIVDILNGKTSGSQYNCAYLNNLHQLLGLRPPVKRTNAHSDIPFEALKTVDYTNTQEIFSKILGYQLYRGFCKMADDTKPYGNDLVNCNLKSSLPIGRQLTHIMKSGKKETWREIIEYIVPEKQLNTDAMVEYFSPLDKILSDIIRENNITVGWRDGPPC